MSEIAGTDIWLKMETHQPVGSYKVRGMGRLCQHHVHQGSRRLVASSGGNAGVAVAYAGRRLGVSVDIFIPSTSSPLFIDAIRAQGAHVHVEGDVWDETNQIAMKHAKAVQAGFVPPFDHPLIWAGHSSMIDEVAAAGVRPEAVVVAVGGGGLACGVLQGMHRWGWDHVPLFAVETQGAASFAACVQAKKHTSIAAIRSLATSLGAKCVTPALFEWYQRHPITSITVSDAQAVDAVVRFLDDHLVMAEPSAGAALSLIYHAGADLSRFRRVLVIVCGGLGVSLSLIQKWQQSLSL